MRWIIARRQFVALPRIPSTTALSPCAAQPRIALTSAVLTVSVCLVCCRARVPYSASHPMADAPESGAPQGAHSRLLEPQAASTSHWRFCRTYQPPCFLFCVDIYSRWFDKFSSGFILSSLAADASNDHSNCTTCLALFWAWRLHSC